MKPSIPKGTRDFSPQEMVKRNYIFDTIRKVYQSYGYQPIETPAMENSETLMGKYGDEGDRLIFKILNSGDFMDGVPPDTLDSKSLTKHISEKALRYDLTVPFARYVVQHRNDITFPFKRYQIQPVWRADRPQKGRYREFYQCDADVIGSDSLLNEVELIQIIDEVFTKLGVPVIIKINNRKILQGIAEDIGAPERVIDVATALDKLDKIGWEGVKKELDEKGFTQFQFTKLVDFIFERMTISADNKDIRILANLNALCEIPKSTESPKPEIITEGAKQLKFIWETIQSINKELSNNIEFDISLARGLNYYTGTIIEVKVDTSKCTSRFTSSICGGGRYDDLTGIFGLPNVSGVGISFGADRIYDVMEELGNRFPKDIVATSKVLVLNENSETMALSLNLIQLLHKEQISAQLYPDELNPKKRGKQKEYASKMGIPYAVSIDLTGEKNKIYKVKKVDSNEQEQSVSFYELISMIK